MKNSARYTILENSVFIIVWLTVFCIPVFRYRMLDSISWSKVFQDWILTASYLLVFVVNLYFLIPALLSKHKYAKYVVAVFVLVLMSASIGFAITKTVNWDHGQGMPPMELGPGLPPMELSESMPPPMGYNLPATLSATAPLLQFVGILMIAFLVIASGTAYKVVLMWIRERKLMKQLQESHISNPASEQEVIFVKANLKNIRVELNHIQYIESANEYIRIYLEKGEVITTFMRLKHIEAKLPAQKFIRVHRSFIINLEKIKTVEKHRILIGAKTYIPIGEHFKKSLEIYLRQKSLHLNPA